MTKRKERSLDVLYGLTEKLIQPEITPVLKGSFPIQGPADAADNDLQRDKEDFPADLRNCKGSVNKNVRMRAEPGTCNVCATPCSSCMHACYSLSFMESKIEGECSNETCGIKETRLLKSRACDDRQTAASETSNLLSSSSCHDSISENAESNISGKASHIFEDVEMVPKLPLPGGGTIGEYQGCRAHIVAVQSEDNVSSPKPTPSFSEERIFSKNFEQRGLECHGDNISCVTGVKDANTASKKNGSGIASTFQCISPKAGPAEYPSSKDMLGIGDSKKMTENLSPQLQGEPSESSMDHVESSLAGSLPTISADGKKFVLPDFDQCKPSLVGSDLSAPMKTEFDMDNENLPSKSAKFSDKSKQAGETNSLQSHLAAESEQSGSDIVEDVKVCDICGDTGREDMLAICSRCSDGAEHTYCMQIMLDKVPEGDWLCEGCKEKEDAENKNSEKPEKTDSATSSKVPSLSEKSQNKGPINPNILPILDTKEQGTEGNHSIKAPPSPQVTRRQSNDLEASSVPTKQAIDTNARSPGRTPLYRGNSLNVLKSTQSQHCNNTKISEASQSLTTSSSNSSSMQTRLLSPRRPFSRSNTFSSLNSKPKVKQVLEDVSQKQKVARESGTRKEDLGRTMGKSMSFKPTTSSHSTANEPKMKMLSHNLSLAEDPKGMNFTKEKQLLERKSSFKSDQSGVSSSPTIPTSVSFRKTDATVTVANKGLVAATASGGEVKKQSLLGVVKKQSSLSVEVKKQLSSAVCNFDEQKQFLSVPKEELKAKDSSSPSGSQQTASAVGRNVRCQKCNDAGHTAQFCTSDSLRVSALKASAMRSSKEGMHKSNKWKDAVEAAMSKTTVHTTNNKVSDQAAELSMSNISLSSEPARSKDKFSSSSSCLRNLPHFEPAFPAREVDPVPSISDSCMKPPMTKVSPQVSLVGHPMRFSAIPEHDYLWQGEFDVHRIGGKFLDFFNGVQAHLSTCASPKVPEVVNKFPRKLLLEEVPRLSSWPLQFQGKGANEDNIALYFFAKDLESYEKYKKLVENMIKNDLALKGNFDRVELLIFSSNQLPEKAHRWNRLFYLWAVFRERRENFSESHPDSHKKLCGDSLAVVTKEKGLPNTVISEVNVSLEIRPEGYVTKELPTGNSSPKQMGAIKSSISADLPSLPSSPKGKTQNCHKKSQSLYRKFVGPFNENMQSPVGDSLLSQYTSSMFPEIRPSTSVGKLGCALDTGSEVNGNVALNEVYRDLKRGNGFDIRPVQATSGHSELSKGTAVSTYSDTANCGQAGFTSSLLARHDISSSSSKKIPGLSSHVQEIGAEGNSRYGQKNVDKEKEMLISNGIWAERDMWREPIKTESSGESSKKRPRYSPDNVSETSVEASRSSLAMAWKENNSTVDGETKQKKIKCYTESSFCSEDGGLFPGILNHNSSLSKVERKGDPAYEDPLFPGNLRAAERSFFPVKLGPVEECRLSNSVPWHVVSVDDEDLPGSDLPSLELALGAEKKSSKKVLPSFLRLIDEKSSLITVPDQVTDGGDDEASSSLSLSLAFPITKTEQTTKPVPKTEQLLPERRHVNTSLLLFGSLTDN